MEQKKGLIYRLTMGKDNQPDFMTSKLPGTRWAVFRDVFFNRFSAMVKISLLTMIFLLPALIWLLVTSVTLQADGTMIPYSSNLGLGYPVVTDAIEIGNVRSFMLNVQRYAILVPLISIAGIGFAGAFHTMKLLAWGEGVSIGSTFFKGIKNNWGQFLFIFSFLGISLFVLMLSINAFMYLTDMNGALKIIMFIFAILQFITMIFMVMFLTTQAVTYKLKLFGLVKNSILFAVALLPHNIFFAIISLFPLLLLAIIPLKIAMFLWMIFAIIGVAYITLVWTVYSQWVFDKFLNDKVEGAVKNRGMYVQTEEEKQQSEVDRIRTRAIKYGMAYTSRRLSSIDEGKTFTPLAENYSRAELQRMCAEKSEMIEEIQNEISTVNAQLEAEQNAIDEENKSKNQKKRKDNKGTK